MKTNKTERLESHMQSYKYNYYICIGGTADSPEILKDSEGRDLYFSYKKKALKYLEEHNIEGQIKSALASIS